VYVSAEAKAMCGKKGCIQMTPKRLKYWEANKINIMNEILTNKFSEANNPRIASKITCHWLGTTRRTQLLER